MQVKQGLSAVLNLRGTVAVASASQDARTHGGGGESQAGVGTKGGLRRRKAEVEGGARRRHAGGCPVEEKKKRKKAGRARQSKQATVGCVSCVCDAWVAGVMVSFPPGWRLLGSGRVPSVAGKLAVDPGAGHASTAHHDVLAAINTLRPSSSLPTLPTLSTLSLPPASRPSPQTTCIARRPPEKKLRLRQCRVPRHISAVPKHTLAMRLFLLPVSTRRSLIYCEKLPSTQSPASRSLLDKLTTKASETWVAWEQDSKAPLNWKKRVTTAGNQALNRIPFEEWGLKTLPALTPTRKKAILSGDEKYQVLYPGLFLPKEKLPGILERLAMEKQGTYRRKMIWSIIAMPFTAPFALVPM